MRAVAEERSFGRAATRIGYTQSAVSQQIASLERALGCRLFERPPGKSKVTLTEAGSIVLHRAEIISAELAAARADLDALKHACAQPLRIGVHSTTAGHVINDILRLWVPEPNTGVILIDSANDEAFGDLLQRGELDVAWMHLPLASPALESIHVLSDPLVLLTPRTSTGPSRHAPVDLRVFRKTPLATLRASPVRALLDEWSSHEGMDLRFAAEADDPRLLCEIAVAQRFSVILPESLAIAPANWDVLGIDRVPPRRLGIAWCQSFGENRRRTAFVQAVSQVYASLSRTRDLTIAAVG